MAPHPRSRHHLVTRGMHMPFYPYPKDTASMKLRAVLQAHILPRLYHCIKVLARAKSTLIELIRKIHNAGDSSTFNPKVGVKVKKQKKLLLGPIKACCAFPSSHILPMPDPEPEQPEEVFGAAGSCVYYDSTWNSVIPANDEECCGEHELSGYLHWLEEKADDVETTASVTAVEADEIDRLAERFIAKCHEKFRLEKQESYRMYQEMLARGI